MSVSLRAATRVDLPALAALERSAMQADAWSEAALAAELDEVPATRCVVVARTDGGESAGSADDFGLVGYAALRAVGDIADVQRVVVAEASRAGGIGRLLVDTLVVEAGRRGCTQALLEVAETNVAARALYAAAGFAVIARRPGYYRDGGDALVLRAEVTDLTRT